MKIAVNGDIIDTEYIYKITPIEYWDDDHSKIKYCFWFKIKLFNGKNIEVKKYIESHNGNYSDWYFIVMEHSKTLLEESKILETKINKLRDSIIKIWSENQSKIPQFNLE